MNDRPSLTVGVGASPGAPATAARRVGEGLVEWLRGRYLEATGKLPIEVDGLVTPPVPVEDTTDGVRWMRLGDVAPSGPDR